MVKLKEVAKGVLVQVANILQEGSHGQKGKDPATCISKVNEANSKEIAKKSWKAELDKSERMGN